MAAKSETKKLVVISGASSGIGKETAIQMSKLGHPLLLLARRVELLEKLNLPNTLCEKVDVADLKTFQVAVKKAEDKFGPVDLLVNNAGVMLLSPFEDQDPSQWHEMLNVNIVGVLNGIKCVVDGMIQRKAGTVINVSSLAGLKPFGNHAVYCATKYAVEGLTQVLRQDLCSKRVRFVVVSPAVVETDLLSHTTNDGAVKGYHDWKKNVFSPEMPALFPIDVANAIIYCYQQPPNVTIRELVICPTTQDS